MQLSIVA